MENQKLTLSQVNKMSAEEFGTLLGSFFDATPEIVEMAHAKGPFNSMEEIYHAICRAAFKQDNNQRIKLLRNYPDFVLELQVEDGTGRIGAVSALSGGLSGLSGDEYSRIFHLNGAYRGVYGIPFILYLPEHPTVESVFETFAQRLQNRREEEIETALEEAMKFSWLRLNLFVDPEA